MDYRINIERVKEYISGAHGEKTREYISVLRGTFMIECNEEKQIVECGQVYRFETDRIYTYSNISEDMYLGS